MPNQKPGLTDPSADTNCAGNPSTRTLPEAPLSSGGHRPTTGLNGSKNTAHKGGRPGQLAPPAPAPAPPPSMATSPALVICRNKHWRYISSFHGPWLHLPPENIEAIAHINFHHPRPRPIDPAVFSDLLQIRKLVESATDLAVRAASDVVPRSSSQHGPAGALGLSFGNQGRGHKISPERKHRMRTEATQQLCRAYHLDEIASSVATMQGASTLEDVAHLVLQRNPDDADAQYVHFFHEKIPSRALAAFTSLEPLDRVVRARPSEPEPLRTRATVKAYKDDCDGAAADLTEALRLVRVLGVGRYKHTMPHETSALKSLRSAEGLEEEKQSSSLETRLLFQRANVYLAIACRYLQLAFPPPGAEDDEASPSGEPTPLDGPQLEARKLVRANAKRAVRDYMAYLKTFDYSRGVSTEVADAFLAKIALVSTKEHRTSASAASWPVSSRDTSRLLTVDQLFLPTPPADLPPFPSAETALVSKNPSAPAPPAPDAEVFTYHPLLTDALHSLLLAHALLQTSTKELLRHAYMVARLARLADGFPLFQASRSAARADWVEVLKRAGGKQWLELATSWESLCAPATVPTTAAPPPAPTAPRNDTRTKKALPAPVDTGSSAAPEGAPAKDTAGGTVGSAAPASAAATAASKPPSASPAPPGPGPLENHPHTPTMTLPSDPEKRKKRWSADDGREYTERAALVARWVREVPSSGPLSGVVPRRKKKGSKKKPDLGGATGSGAASPAPPAESDGDGAAESGEDVPG